MLLAKLTRFNVFRISVGCAVLVVSLVVGPVHGHHSYYMYDLGGSVSLEGRLTEFDYKYPHGYITLEVPDERGEVVVWEIETVSPIELRDRGIAASALVVGDWIRIEGFPPRNTERRLVAGNVITKADGTELVVGIFGPDIPGPAIAAVATDLSGIWQTEADFEQISFKNILGAWPLTEIGRDALARFDGSQTPSVDCVPYAPPSLFLQGHVASVEIGDTAVIIRTNYDDSDRIIYVDGRPHPESAEPTTQGHSIGHWEDDALIVDTIHFTEHLTGNALGVPAGLEKHLTERFALSEDGTKLNYSYSIEDPEFLTGPATGGSQWTFRPDVEPVRATCDLESARRFLDAF